VDIRLRIFVLFKSPNLSTEDYDNKMSITYVMTQQAKLRAETKIDKICELHPKKVDESRCAIDFQPFFTHFFGINFSFLIFHCTFVAPKWA